MLAGNFKLSSKFLAVDLVGSFLYFPLWWYSAGLLRTAKYCVRVFRAKATRFGVVIWIKNLFVPMYGQHDMAGRLVSFFMRVLTIVYYSVVLVVLIVFLLALMAAWMVFPLVVASGFFGQLIAYIGG